MNPISIWIGFSHHNVPSLSNTATRSAGGTKSGPPSVVTRATKSTIALVAGVSFHEASAALASSVAAIAGQSRANAIRASSARSTNGWPLTSTMALWIVPPTNAQGLSPG